MVQYKITDPKQLGTFQPAGDLINLEGQLGTYATVLEASASTASGDLDHRLTRRPHPGRSHRRSALDRRVPCAATCRMSRSAQTGHRFPPPRRPDRRRSVARGKTSARCWAPQGGNVISKRWRAVLAAGVVASFVMAACGSDDKATTTTAAATTTAGAATTAAAAATAASGGRPRRRPAAGHDDAAAAATTERQQPAARAREQVDPGSKNAAAGGRRPGRRRLQGHERASRSTRRTARATGTPTRASPTRRSTCSTACRRRARWPASVCWPTVPRRTSSTSTTTAASTVASIVLDTKDDGYKPDQTKTNVDEALGSKKYASLFVTLGHAEQPGDLGRDQRRVHAPAAQRHRCRAVG